MVGGAVPRAWQGYPEEIKELPDYDPNFFQRGLMIDKERGNVIKMDRHSYVKVAYHGTSPLNKEEMSATFLSSELQLSAEFHSSDKSTAGVALVCTQC